MIVEDQKDIVAFLRNPASFGSKSPVEEVETHISHIFLVGDRAFKLKRAVKLPYVDFSTADLRLAYCAREVEFNSPFAPGLYIGVRRINREVSGDLSLDGDGEKIDALVEMRRFDEDKLFDRMAEAGALSEAAMSDVARMIAAYHDRAPIIHAGSGSDNIAGVLDINEAGFRTSSIFSSAEQQTLNTAFREGLVHWRALLDQREMEGKVRRCHGDLHLRNICLFQGAPNLFDCIEFNDRIATVDVLYDVAFLLMDLWHRNLPAFANLAINHYLDIRDDEGGFVLLPYFMALRAAVRAHITATQAEDAGPDRQSLVDLARSYFDLAAILLREPPPPRLLAIGGFSGSGKSTLAGAIAPRIGLAPGARIIESDRTRKAMFGASPETHLPQSAYAPEVSEKVYAEMRRKVDHILRAGGSVVTNAVFDRLVDRQAIESIAVADGVRCEGFWLNASPKLLDARVRARLPGASDATPDIVALQLGRGGSASEWHQVDASHGIGELVDKMTSTLDSDPAPSCDFRPPGDISRQD